MYVRMYVCMYCPECLRSSSQAECWRLWARHLARTQEVRGERRGEEGKVGVGSSPIDHWSEYVTLLYKYTGCKYLPDWQ